MINLEKSYLRCVGFKWNIIKGVRKIQRVIFKIQKNYQKTPWYLFTKK